MDVSLIRPSKTSVKPGSARFSEMKAKGWLKATGEQRKRGKAIDRLTPPQLVATE